MILAIALGAIVAPFLIHEMGHWIAAKMRGVPLRWVSQGWRLAWLFAEGCVPSKQVRRELAISGFVAELSGGLAFALVSGFWPEAFLGAGLYGCVSIGHLWRYAVFGRAGFDDFSLLRNDDRRED